MKRFIAELRRRNVIRMAFLYLPASWGIVQIVDILGPAFGWPDASVRITTIILALLFPVALVLSWLYEFTPEGLKLETDIAPSISSSKATGKKLDRLIILTLLIAVVIMGFDRFILDPSRDATRERQIARDVRTETTLQSLGPISIAVLPFVNLSAEPDTDYFTDGVSEEILNALAKVRLFRVISRSSSWQFRENPPDIPLIGKQLNANHILEGSVRLSGHRVRVTAQLIDALTDSHLWSETFDRDIGDVFAVQDEIATAIVDELQSKLAEASPGGVATPRPRSIAAYQAFLRGRHFISQRSEEMIALGVNELQQAVKLEPDYAAAHAELAIGIRLQVFDVYGSSLTSDQAFEMAWPHADKAIALDPNLAESHAAFGFLKWHAGDVDAAETHFREALRLNPSYAIANNWLSILLATNRGDRREAFELRRINTELDPLSPIYKFNYTLSLISRHRFAEAQAELELLRPLSESHYLQGKARLVGASSPLADGGIAELESVQVEPKSEFLRGRLAYRLFVLGLPIEAKKILLEPPIELEMLAGNYDEGIKLANALEPQDGRMHPDVMIGFGYANQGKYETALPFLESAWARNSPQLFPRAPDGFVIAATLVKVRQELQRSVDSDGLLTAMRKHVGQFRDAGIVGEAPIYSVDLMDGLIALVAGEQPRAMALLENAVMNDVYIPANYDVFESMRSHPDYNRIITMQGHTQRRERERLLAMICIDNPFTDIWEPEIETCEAYR